MIPEKQLRTLYVEDRRSVSEIAKRLKCSAGRIDYWLKKYDIQKRSISEAVYQSWNPDGDPFSIRAPRNTREAILFGLGIGLYWGEGTKANKNSVRLGNSDPALIRKFIDFLTTFYRVDRGRLRFGLQIFGDMEKERVQKFWADHLEISKKQFYPSIVITPYRGVGSYRRKTRHGVLTLYFNNKKLRDTICGAIEQIAQKPM